RVTGAAGLTWKVGWLVGTVTSFPPTFWLRVQAFVQTPLVAAPTAVVTSKVTMPPGGMVGNEAMTEGAAKPVVKPAGHGLAHEQTGALTEGGLARLRHAVP